MKAIIVDDEQHCIDHLLRLIENLQGDVEVIASCSSVGQAKEAIAKINPDVVFLDVHLQDETGFDLLRQLHSIDFEIVFTTAYDAYAVDAFRFSAIDYLLKPITPSDFERAVSKMRKKIGLRDTAKKLEVLFHNFQKRTNGLNKIAVPTIDGITFLPVSEIVRCQSDANYTHIYLLKKGKITAAKTLKYFEDLLANYHFFRTHNSHLVNLKMVEKYVKGKGGYILMADGSSIEVAVRRKEEFLKRLSGI